MSARQRIGAGSVQIARCCSRFDAIDGFPRLRAFADEPIESANTAQPVTKGIDGVGGGVPGSALLRGRYGSRRHLNRAAELMADALMGRSAGGLPRHRLS